jgi:hypothetical protein
MDQLIFVLKSFSGSADRRGIEEKRMKKSAFYVGSVVLWDLARLHSTGRWHF